MELLPFLRQKYNPSLEKSLCRLADLARDDSELLWELADQAYQSIVTAGEQELLLRADTLVSIPPSLQRRVLIRAWQQLSGEVVSPAYERIDALRELVVTGHTGQVIQLPGGIRGEKSYQQLILGKPTGHNGEQEQFSYQVKIPGHTKVPELNLMVITELLEIHTQSEYGKPEEEPAGATTLELDADLCGRLLVIRNRREGDTFHPLGAPGKKKLKEFFINSKVPRAERDRLPLLCLGNEVIWVVGKRKSQSCRVTETTRQKLRLVVEKA